MSTWYVGRIAHKLPGFLRKRIRKFFEHRKGHIIKIQDSKFVLEFEKLDDARMFVLAFNDVIENNGVNYE